MELDKLICLSDTDDHGYIELYNTNYSCGKYMCVMQCQNIINGEIEEGICGKEVYTYDQWNHMYINNLMNDSQKLIWDQNYKR